MLSAILGILFLALLTFYVFVSKKEVAKISYLFDYFCFLENTLGCYVRCSKKDLWEHYLYMRKNEDNMLKQCEQYEREAKNLKSSLNKSESEKSLLNIELDNLKNKDKISQKQIEALSDFIIYNDTSEIYKLKTELEKVNNQDNNKTEESPEDELLWFMDEDPDNPGTNTIYVPSSGVPLVILRIERRRKVNKIKEQFR